MQTTAATHPSSSLSDDTAVGAARSRARDRFAPVLVWLAALVYVVVLSLESISAHRSFVTGFDTALYDQFLWLLANGHEPFSTIVSKPILADHFQPGLALLTPLYWLGAGVSALLVVQSAALAADRPGALRARASIRRAAGARSGTGAPLDRVPVRRSSQPLGVPADGVRLRAARAQRVGRSPAPARGSSA